MCIFCIWCLLCWGMFFLYLVCEGFLSWKDVVFCPMLFYIYWDDLVIFFIYFIDVTCILICICWTILAPVINSGWSLCISLLMCSLVYQYFVENFPSIFIGDISCVVSLSGFGTRYCWLHRMSLEVTNPSFWIVWKNLKKIGVNSSLRVW